MMVLELDVQKNGNEEAIGFIGELYENIRMHCP